MNDSILLSQDMLKELLEAGLSLNQLASMPKNVEVVDIEALGENLFQEVEPHIKKELIQKILAEANVLNPGEQQMGGTLNFITELVNKLKPNNKVSPSPVPQTVLNDLPVDILMEIANHLDKKDQQNLVSVLEPANGNPIRTQNASKEIIEPFLNKEGNENYNPVNVCLSYVIYQALITCIRTYITEMLVYEKELIKQNRRDFLIFGHHIKFKTTAAADNTTGADKTTGANNTTGADKTVVVSYYLTAIKKEDGQLEYTINYLVLNDESFNEEGSITFYNDDSIKTKLFSKVSDKHAFMNLFLNVVGTNTISFKGIEIKMMTVKADYDIYNLLTLTSLETIKNPVDWWNFRRERRLFLSTLSKIASPFVNELIHNVLLQGTKEKEAAELKQAADDAEASFITELVETPPPIASCWDSPIPSPITNYLIIKFPSWKAVLYLQYLMHFLYGHCNKPDADRILKNLSDHLKILYGFDVYVSNIITSSQPPWKQEHAVLNQILVVFIDSYNRETNGHHLVTEGNFAKGNLMIHVRFGAYSLSDTYSSLFF